MEPVPLEQPAAVTTGKGPILHFQLEISELSTSVEVSDALSRLNTQGSTVQTLVSPQEICPDRGSPARRR